MSFCPASDVRRRRSWKLAGNRAVVVFQPVEKATREEDRSYLLRPLSARHKAILAALTDEPQRGIDIALKTGIPYNAVKGDLMRLSTRRLASKVGRGLWVLDAGEAA